MRKVVRSVSAAVVSAAVLAGPAAAQDGPVFGARDDGRTVVLAGADFTVALPRDAGADRRWSYMDGREVFPLAPDGEAGPGPAPSAAVVRFHLRATGPAGRVEIGLFPADTPGAPVRVWRLDYHRTYDPPLRPRGG